MKIKLDEGAFPPVRAHETDAGLDLFSPVAGQIAPFGSLAIDTGVHMAIPVGWTGLVRSRSGLLFARGIYTDGTIDSDYRGSIRIKLINHSTTPYEVWRGDKIAQIVIVPCMLCGMEVVDELEETERGSRGFGSSGR